MNEKALQNVFMLFLRIMPDEEAVSFAEFVSKLEQKEHDQAFRKLLEDFTTDNHEHEHTSVETKLAITLFRELLK